MKLKNLASVLIVLLLCVLLVGCLVACGDKDNTTPGGDNTDDVTPGGDDTGDDGDDSGDTPAPEKVTVTVNATASKVWGESGKDIDWEFSFEGAPEGSTLASLGLEGKVSVDDSKIPTTLSVDTYEGKIEFKGVSDTELYRFEKGTAVLTVSKRPLTIEIGDQTVAYDPAGVKPYTDGTNVTFGGYVPYNADDPTHWGAELYFKYSEGYYPASADATADNGYIRYSYSVDGGFYSDDNGAYIKLEGREETGRGTLYYYSLIDSGYQTGYTVYSKRECDYIFLENAESGGWVNVAGEWEEYDPDTHTDVEMRYDRVIGYIGNDAANDGGTEAGLAPLTDISVNVLDEKSPTILISLLERQVTIGSLNETIDTLTIGEMMEIEPGSVFDDPALSGSTVDGLSANVTSMFTDMTIGKLLKYANIAVSPQVSYILQDVKLADFFGALEYQYQNGQLTVNMEKLFGIE